MEIPCSTRTRYASASGWNGAFLAEVARISPPQSVGAATGSSLFVVNVGKQGEVVRVKPGFANAK